MSPARARRDRQSFVRDDGQRRLPGCTGSGWGLHDHHTVLRSQAGGDEESDRLGACVTSHLHLIHKGFVRVSGSIETGLVVELGVAHGLAPLSVWIDERRRA